MNKYKSAPWLIVTAALLWAVDAPFRKFLTGDLDASAIVMMEHLLIVFFVLVLFIPRREEVRELSWKDWLAVGFIAFGGSALATIFFTESFSYVNPSVAILLQKVQPLVAILLAAVILKERLSKQFWLWAGFAIFGTYLVTFPDVKISGLSLSGGTLGVIYALAAAVLWAGSTVFGRFVLRKVSFQMMTALRFMGAFVFLSVLNTFQGNLGEIHDASLKDWLFVAIIALLAGYISLFIYYKGLKYTEAKIATIGELAFPFAAVIINWIFLDAALSYVQIIGGVVLLAAMSRLSIINTKELGTQTTTNEQLHQNV